MPSNRNYSFVGSDPDRFDQIDVAGKTVPIPARVGSTYWAILKFAYSHPDQPLHLNQLTSEVSSLLKDHDDVHWECFRQKAESKHWTERIIMSAKLLTRREGNHPFGLRCYEQGFAFRFARDGAGEPYFILRTGQHLPDNLPEPHSL